MNIAVYLLLLAWTFFTGFLIGITFIDFKKRPITVTRVKPSDENDDFSYLSEQYRNFLSYDGSKQ